MGLRTPWRALAAGLLLASSNIALAQETAPTAETVQAADPVWAFETSDVPVDPGYVFGQLQNGLRYVVRENATPEGTALVRLVIGSGSLDEADSEQGLAHYLEHMAFNGTTNIPEGEMIKLLEREGLAFGADTNASTGFEVTEYKLDLPRNDAELLDIALMLMRETASEMLIEEGAVERERGVILAERRDRNTFQLKEARDSLEFAAPNARFPDRFPIGTLEVLENATAADLRRFYERTYVPANAAIVIIGDFPAEVMEAKIRDKFSNWEAAPDPAEPVTGPIDLGRSGETHIFLDPALSEQVSIGRYRAWEDRPDTIENRRLGTLRSVGYAIINRRLAALARGESAPFRGASFSSSDLFEDARATSITVGTADGEWREGMLAASKEVRRALEFGFTESEVAEQVARIRQSLENGVAASSTRTNGALLSGALGLINNDRVPSTPESGLERFEGYVSSITPEAALAAVKADAAPLVDPLIRFRGRTAPDGGKEALRTAWADAQQLAISPPEDTGIKKFAYTDFGPPGEVVSDTIDERFDFRLITFANGVRLNLKQTDIRENRIRFALTLDGGSLLNTAEDPLKTVMIDSLPLGGLGQHSQDELETVLAGRSVSFSLSSRADSFRIGGGTIPEDLELQLQLLAAGITDPGYRREGEERYRRSIDNFFANLDATPGRALRNALGGILSGGDPRFTLQPEKAYLDRSFEKLKSDTGDRMINGAIELALVGDFDPDTAIAAVASTLGALPMREANFNPREEARTRPFTDKRGQVIITHTGEQDQALVRQTWPTTDDSDLTETLRLALLNRVVRLKLQEQLREDLGQAYSPSSSSSPSRIYRGYGTFNLSASVDVSEVEPTRAAIRTIVDELRIDGVDEDTLNRARQPLLEGYDNALKSLGGWIGLADRAQSESERLNRFVDAPDILRSLTPEDVQSVANRYLDPDQVVEIVVLPEETEPSAPATMQ
ncbi:MAG: insulinase family protein [Pseudomonadota bacterium]